MQKEQTLRVGIVGAGNNTRNRHIPLLKAIDHVEIVSLVNRSPESSQRVADEFGIPKTYPNWRELVYADDTDAIVIGTWPYMHHPVTLAALDAGKHVMVEARMAMNATEAQEMAAAAHQHPELVTQIVPSPMTLHLDTTIKRLIADGYLGDLIAIELQTKGDFVNVEGPLHWRHNRRLSGLNIMSMGIWYEAIMRWVGPAKTVMAMGQTIVKSRVDDSGNHVTIQIPDYVNIMAKMVCGAQLSMRLTSVTGLEAPGDALSLFGTQGTLQIRNGVLYGGQRGDSDLLPIDIPDHEKQGWRVEEEFVGAIRGLEPITHTTFDDGLAYMQFTEAVHRSMDSQQAVTLPLMI